MMGVINNIFREFVAKEDKIYFFDAPNSITCFCCSTNSVLWQTQLEEGVQHIFILDQYLMISTLMNGNLVLNYNGDILGRTAHPIRPAMLNSKNDSFFYTSGSITAKYSLASMSPEWETEQKSGVFMIEMDNEVYSFSSKTKTISAFSTSNGDVLWTKTLPKLQLLIGVAGGKLWISIDQHTLLACNCKTGEDEFEISEVPNFISEWLPSKLPETKAMVAANKKLMGLMWEFYWEIDASDGSVVFYDLTQEFKAMNIRNERYPFVADRQYIYFLQVSKGKVGVFDTTSKTINNIIDLTVEYGPVQVLEIRNGKDHVLVSDSAKNLHYIPKSDLVKHDI